MVSSMIRLILTVALLSISILTQAQSRTITGRVLDLESRKPVRDADVQVEGTDLKATTNTLGFFQLTVTGTGKIIIQHPGYEMSAVDLPDAPQFTTLVKPIRYYLPGIVVGGRGKDTTLLPDDLILRSRLDSLYPDIRYSGGWLKWYAKLEAGLKAMSPDNYYSDPPFDSIVRIQFSVDAKSGVTGVKIDGCKEPARRMISAVLGGLSDWEIKPGKGNVWHFVAEEINYNVYTVVEVSAHPVNGFSAFYREVAENIKYPDAALRKKIEGRVFVEFIIERDGRITNVRTIKGIGYGCDEEAARVLSLSKHWVPGSQRGVRVRQRYTLPIGFYTDGGASAAQRSSDVPAPGDLRKWLSDHITYPSQARVYGTQGTVLLRFRVLSNGKLDSAEVLNNAAAELGAKALSALRETPLSVTKAFIPKNKRLILPVHFGIDQAKEVRFRDLEQGSEVLPGISVVVPSIGTRPGAVTFDESRQDPALTVVDMTDLSVTELPANLSGLAHVSKVILQNNKLQTISPEIGKLTGLTELYLSNNLINALPVSLANLQSLRLIALANNKLTEFPSVLFALSKLEVIHVGGNQIPTLPPAINLLTKLESLYLQNNKLQTLPEEVFQLPKLKLLHLGGNPLSDAERKRIKERLPKVDVRF